MFANERLLQIEWGDCDPANIVFYPRYFAFFDASTAALFAAMGYSLKYVREGLKDVGFPMVDTRSQFYKASQYGDEVLIKSEFVALGRASFEVKHQLFNAGDLAVECNEKRVWACHDELGALQAKPIPSDIRASMLGHQK